MTEGHLLFENWVEMIALVLLAVGLVIAILSPNIWISYAIVFLSGMIGGRLIYERKHDPHFPHFFMMVGFLLGFVVGSFFHGGSAFVITVLFVAGIITSYQLYNREILQDTFF